MFHTKVASYPVERTLLTTEALHFLMESRHNGGVLTPTPDLAKIAYQAPPEGALIRTTNPRPRDAATVASKNFIADYPPKYLGGDSGYPIDFPKERLSRNRAAL